MNDLNKLLQDIISITERVFESQRWGRPVSHAEFDMIRRDIDRIIPTTERPIAIQLIERKKTKKPRSK
jgi:hypothetical protein